MAAPKPNSSNREAHDFDIALDIGTTLAQTVRAYHQALRAELAPYGVTVRQSQVLGWLRKKGDLSQCQLARLLTIEPATLVGVLERMERDGQILRFADPSDGRQKRVGLNRSAEQLAQNAIECSARVSVLAVEEMSSDEIRRVRGMLRRILISLRDSTDTRGVDSDAE